ncbi:hypothetical protein [Nakamurella lactea]|uniref:hypothetical protein n=1 Tax=Nakamurella lactea TaxID=459515 RepID=UPI00040CD539|nr:hypothetical protein [Nakamurella lactea]
MRAGLRWAAPIAVAALLVSGCTGDPDAGPTTEPLATMSPGGSAVPLPPLSGDPAASGSSADSPAPGSTRTVASTATSGPASPSTSSGPTTGPPTSTSTAPTRSTSKSGTGTGTGTGKSTTGAGGPTISAQEAADRKAAQDAWLAYWKVYNRLPATPIDKRAALIATSAVDPLARLTLESAAISDQNNVETWGTLGHKFTWKPEINGSDMAMFNDCLDQSKWGTRDRTTKKVTGKGVADRLVRVSVTRSKDAIWRVERYDALGDGKCS